MRTRPARTRTEVDLLPPWGQPEVVTTGNGALDVAVFAVGVAGAVAYAANK